MNNKETNNLSEIEKYNKYDTITITLHTSNPNPTPDEIALVGDCKNIGWGCLKAHDMKGEYVELPTVIRDLLMLWAGYDLED